MRWLLSSLYSLKSDYRVIAFILILLFFIVSSPNYNLVVCKSETQPCLIYANILGFKRSKKFLAPNAISSYETQYYYRRSRFSSSTSYKLNIVSTMGSRHVLFLDYGDENSAIRTGEEFITCIKAKNFPCEISKY